MVNDLYFTFWETIATILVNKLTLGKEEKNKNTVCQGNTSILTELFIQMVKVYK